MAVYSDTIELKDNVSGAAARAAKETKILQSAIESTQNALVKASATGNVKQYQALSKQLEGYKSSLALLPPIQDSVSLSTQDMGIQSAALGGELAALTGGLSYVATALVAVAAAFGAAVLAGAAFAIEASEAKQKSLALFDALGAGVSTGEEVDNMLTGLKDKIGLAKDTMGPWAEELMAMGVTALPELEKGITAVASASAMMGAKGAQSFLSLQKKIQLAVETGEKLKIPINRLGALGDTGLQVSDVAAEMGIKTEELAKQLKDGSVNAEKFGNALQDAMIKKGAGPLARMGNSLTTIWGKFKDDIADMFEDIDIGPFLTEVKSLFEIFGQGKASGQAMKAGITGFFNETFAAATKLVPMIKHFFLDLVIWSLQAYIAMKPIIKWFKELLENETVINIMKGALVGLGAVLGVIAVSVAGIVGFFLALNAAAFAAVGGIIMLATMIVDELMGAIEGVSTFGSEFIEGLITGITDGAAAVVGAVTGIADKAKNAFKSALGISSPSKVMMQMGGFVGEGAAQGIEGASQDVHAASSDLAGAAMGGFSGDPGGGNSGGKVGGGGGAITVEATINFNGAVQGAAELTEQAISLIFERVALEQGL